MMGYIYIGYNNRKLKHGVFKIGMTTRTPKARATEIRKAGDTSFKPIGWIKVDDTHMVELLLIESIIRYIAWRDYNVKHYGNDHFAYDVEAGAGKVQMYDMAKELLSKTVEISSIVMNKALEIEWA